MAPAGAALPVSTPHIFSFHLLFPTHGCQSRTDAELRAAVPHKPFIFLISQVDVSG